MAAQEYKSGTLGHRMRMKLESSPDFEDLLLLRELDNTKEGSRRAPVGTVDEARISPRTGKDEWLRTEGQKTEEQRTENRRQKTENRRQRDRGQRTEDRRQKTTEDRRQRTEEKGQRTEGGPRLRPASRKFLPILAVQRRIRDPFTSPA